MLPWRRTKLESTLLAAWMHRSIWTRLAWPLALVFFGLLQIRRVLFKHGVLRIHRVNAFVIVVGNVVIGGTGKTPTVISIANYLTSQGYRVGIISRGFGRIANHCTEVTSIASPQEVGDEPTFIHHRTGLPVFVSRNRYEAATALLAKYPTTNIIVCDDGLQHYALYRDLEICLFDARGCGNGWILPAGPLREPWPRYTLRETGQSSDRLLVLHTGTHATFAGYRAQRSLNAWGVDCNGRRITLSTLATVGAKPLMAVAGIAQPQNFFVMLQDQGICLAKTLALPDHYNFDDFECAEYLKYQLVCTEKDAPKLWKKLPDAVAVGLTQTIEPAFFSRVRDHIASTQASSPSSLPL